ncbi:uncharacterized protein BDZ83DRAFT_609141 [Colletotrichum acutatum]|uniref:Uncharacterized protein n=1 Tax=Glomerella acutata TaxID=27357 RepID=A0AAD8UT92_GLOAC|nr:uncharacterized protein BDZ83DRAFT_609141 [Colletotrichum acutatum]KAK1728422.1 hypothetical protein BDZ83DRAFT_609141 [Colletotrichum acutatum]
MVRTQLCNCALGNRGGEVECGFLFEVRSDKAWSNNARSLVCCVVYCVASLRVGVFVP